MIHVKASIFFSLKLSSKVCLNLLLFLLLAVEHLQRHKTGDHQLRIANYSPQTSVIYARDELYLHYWGSDYFGIDLRTPVSEHGCCRKKSCRTVAEVCFEIFRCMCRLFLDCYSRHTFRAHSSFSFYQKCYEARYCEMPLKYYTSQIFLCNLISHCWKLKYIIVCLLHHRR